MFFAEFLTVYQSAKETEHWFTERWSALTSIYGHIDKLWRERDTNPELKRLMWERLIEWRREPTVKRVKRPTRIDRARRLGYKAKQGYVIARVKIGRGSLNVIRPVAGRRPTKLGVNKITLSKSSRWVAEEKAARRFPNLTVLNSYYVAEDGKHKWYEVILVDPDHPSILSDPNINWVCNPVNRGRVFRGLTSAGKKSRGLRRKGRGAEKARPSLLAHGHRLK
jgi:large subunit ribosomal protein L15e